MEKWSHFGQKVAQSTKLRVCSWVLGIWTVQYECVEERWARSETQACEPRWSDNFRELLTCTSHRLVIRHHFTLFTSLLARLCTTHHTSLCRLVSETGRVMFLQFFFPVRNEFWVSSRKRIGPANGASQGPWEFYQVAELLQGHRT